MTDKEIINEYRAVHKTDRDEIVELEIESFHLRAELAELRRKFEELT